MKGSLPGLLMLCLCVIVWSQSDRCANGPCWPGSETCGPPVKDPPIFHLKDQHGCAENDPNGPVFDPVHGVIHHFYQSHLAALVWNGGPIYGHFVSKDFVHWAQMPVAIWNGLDSSVWPPRTTPYDTQAIFTGSAVVVDGAGPDGVGPGVVNIYPGLCDRRVWPNCSTGTLLAQAVPADYAGDELLTNWTKPSYNPIMENTQRDPSTPWKTPSGEWRLRTYNSLYGSASDADLLAGRWYPLGSAKEFKEDECPSFYPLPGPTPGFEQEYLAAKSLGALPTHVQKLGRQDNVRDVWQMGTYDPQEPHTTGHFYATAGWEDVFAEKIIDQGNYYASKDNVYPSQESGVRRVNWGWVTLPGGLQALPREITFNAATRCLEQAPLAELSELRGPAACDKSKLALEAGAPVGLGLPAGLTRHCDLVVVFALPETAATFGITSDSGFSCTVEYAPPPASSTSFYEVPITCGYKDVLRLTSKEKTLEMRIFADGGPVLEAYLQKGRVAITSGGKLGADVFLTSNTSMQADASVFPMNSIWVSPQDVRSAPRRYQTTSDIHA